MTKPICIIAARAGSKRLPGKNKIDFNGRPIITYPIRAAKASGIFSHVIVSTDDPEIMAIADAESAWGWPRPSDLAADNVEETQVYLDILSHLDISMVPQYFCAIYPTAAFITPHDIVTAYHHIDDTEADACMGVTKFDIHPFRTMTPNPDGFLSLVAPPINATPSREWPPAYASNGTLYWFRTSAFMANPTYFPEKLIGFETFAIDIDTQADLDRARKHVIF